MSDTFAVVSTCFYHEERFYARMVASAREHGLDPYLLGVGATQVSGHTGDEQGPLLIEHLKARSEKYVLVCDAPDVLFLAGEREIMQKFHWFDSPMVVSAEDTLFPSLPELQCLYDISGRHRFVNIGLWIGEREYSIECLQRSIDLYRHNVPPGADDLDNPQAWMMRGYAAGTIDFDLDRDCYLFQSMGSSRTCGDVVIEKNGRPYNTFTKTYPVAIHYNGHAAYGMDPYNKMFKDLYGELC